jgi:hypothetical protein
LIFKEEKKVQKSHFKWIFFNVKNKFYQKMKWVWRVKAYEFQKTSGKKDTKLLKETQKQVWNKSKKKRKVEKILQCNL